jgi:hypothetical protein
MRQPPPLGSRVRLSGSHIFRVWTFGKLNRSSRIQLCGFLENDLPGPDLALRCKCVGMEYDKRLIIKFLWKEAADARDIADRLHAQFSQHTYQFRTVQFWITEIRRGH